MPYEAVRSGKERVEKTLYVCVDGDGTAQITMWAETLGYGSGVGARFACDGGDCGDFVTIAPETNISWARGYCRHLRKQFMGSVTLLPGRYTLYTMADNSGKSFCKGNAPFNYIL